MTALFLLGWIAAIAGMGTGIGQLVSDWGWDRKVRVRWIALVVISAAAFVPLFVSVVAGLDSGC